MERVLTHLKVIILHIFSRVSIIAAAILAIGVGSSAIAATNAGLANPFKAGPGVTSNVVSATTTSTGQVVTMSGMRSAYTLKGLDSGGGITLFVTQNVTQATTTYTGPVRLHFSDSSVGWNNWYNAGPSSTEYMDSEAPAQVVRLYNAAFGRAPDLVAAGSLLKQRDDGKVLREVAATLSGSPAMAGLTDAQFLEQVFRNVFHSEMPLEWRNNWIARWAQFANIGIPNAQARAEFLAFYAEMEVNRLSLFEQYRNGVDYKPVAPAPTPRPPSNSCPRCALP